MSDTKNEVKAIPELLDILCLKGCVVTIDAMGIQKEIARKIIEKEADYILQVEGTQETLMNDIASHFKEVVIPIHTECAETFGKMLAFADYQDRVKVLQDGGGFCF